MPGVPTTGDTCTSGWCRLLLKSLIAATEQQQAELSEPLMELYGQALLHTPQVLSSARCWLKVLQRCLQPP